MREELIIALTDIPDEIVLKIDTELQESFQLSKSRQKAWREMINDARLRHANTLTQRLKRLFSK